MAQVLLRSPGPDGGQGTRGCDRAAGCLAQETLMKSGRTIPSRQSCTGVNRIESEYRKACTANRKELGQ